MVSDEVLAQILRDGQFLEEEAIERALRLAQAKKIPLEQVLVETESLSDQHLGQLIANEVRLPYVNLREQPISREVLTLIPQEFATAYELAAFRVEQGTLHVACHNPSRGHFVQLLEKKTGLKVALHYATLNDLRQTYHRYQNDLGGKIMVLVKDLSQEDPKKKGEEEDSRVIQIVDLLLSYAYSSKASDLHIEPQEVETVVRFRIDGVLEDVLSFPKSIHDRLSTRLKILSTLRTDEHFSAQDGHLSYQFEGEKVDIRISILPTTYGEKVVMRLLSERSRQFSLEEIGLSEKDLNLLKSQAEKPWGMILVTGPTGSGKTTTLYAVLKLLNERSVNISTIEDPVEYSISGVNQIQVNPKTNLTFASGLRSVVRQDPDIIMVGEIRDQETADISINAALTGHLLLSTLHTNDAATALPRLLDMGIEPFLVASTVNVVVAQRLVRKICKSCILSYEATPQDLEQNNLLISDKMKAVLFPQGKQTFYRGGGCDACHHSGYLGRIGVFEILIVDAAIRKMVLDGASSDVVQAHAIQQGMTTMFDDAMTKVLQGQTTLDDVLRVVRE